MYDYLFMLEVRQLGHRPSHVGVAMKHGNILGELPKPAEIDKVARLEARVSAMETTVEEIAALVQRMKERIAVTLPKPS